MKKTLYSLMLNEEVVREIDALAHQMGTNRSALINQILADYTSVITPERRIESIFHAIEEMVAPARELVPFFVPNAMTMSLKSSLEYKYRPTVKYEVALFDDTSDTLGELSVIFRTQSAALLQSMTQFFRLWKQIEDVHLTPYLAGTPPRYALYDGKFVRSLSLPRNRDYTSEEIAKAISDYIKLFDHLMKGFLSGKYTAQDVESIYYAKRGDGVILI
ncbi:MAG: CopG family transcriptional regulator [Oscillospiraceae bacterium]|nr:ribbon-helix-helix domain-containing protein [Clostridiales bacterium]MDD6077683.1 ribbon-helix-helix domain-containing protein [Clostridiales bacterium]MDD6937337.1 ribbon-helix-helix domain-containing protein [Clostridiales bacterium]MDY2962548.1 CopG family transcriptional regulator [Oscillospiraceae bacterium]